MKFIWNIVDKSIIDKLTVYTNYKATVQYHSDVYYDIFQLKMVEKMIKIIFKYKYVVYQKIQKKWV